MIIQDIQFYFHLNENLNQKIISSIIYPDNAAELFNTSLEEFFFQNGIKHQSSCSYTHKQVEAVERMNQTIANSARAMLEHSGFPAEYRDLTFQTAVYVRSLCPSEANDSYKTPFELWNLRTPDISHLKTFGEPAYVHIPKENRKKLDSKSELTYFFEYGEDLGSEGYKLLDLNSNRIHVASDVTFLRNPKFPKYECNRQIERNQHSNQTELMASASPEAFSTRALNSLKHSNKVGALRSSKNCWKTYPEQLSTSFN
jgi:hypothetical protein